jgi:hypothetical protein
MSFLSWYQSLSEKKLGKIKFKKKKGAQNPGKKKRHETYAHNLKK